MDTNYFFLNNNTAIKPLLHVSPPIENALNIFRRDMGKVLKKNPLHKGKDSEIRLKYVQEFNNAILRPETFHLVFEFTEDKKQILNILGRDELSIVYGLLYISRQYLGVEPFWFWNDKEPQPQDYVKIPPVNYTSTPYKVRFRGWFINDEVLLTGWKDSPDSEEVWRSVFEALLRCGGNMVIPGTDKTSRLNRKLASDMGLWITHHHAEPLGSDFFTRLYPDKEPSYGKHKDLFEKLWTAAVINQKDIRTIWNVGFRGQGDYPFWHDDPDCDTPEARGRLIGNIIKKQCDIVKNYVDNPIFCTNLYGEILDLYNKKYLDIPEDVIKIWADNGYGKMVSRRQGNNNPRIPALPREGDKGLHGIYYHVSFHDLQASNHLTMLQNPPEFVNRELKAAFDAGAVDYLIVNAGSVKPHIYMLDLVSRVWAHGFTDTKAHLRQYVNTYFGSQIHLVCKCFEDYFNSAIQYGVHDDEKAGEQFYHYPVRIIISHWIKGCSEKTEDALKWLKDNASFEEQVKYYGGLCQQGLDRWERLEEQAQKTMKLLAEGEKQLFSDSIMLQILIHSTGCKGALLICKSFKAFKDGDYVLAFIYACDAKNAYNKGLEAMGACEHNKWKGFYKNDCLTNIKLTIYFIDTLRRYLRVLGDGTELLKWERKYLYPEEERGIMAVTTFHNQLSDDELYRGLSRIFENRR